MRNVSTASLEQENARLAAGGQSSSHLGGGPLAYGPHGAASGGVLLQVHGRRRVGPRDLQGYAEREGEGLVAQRKA